MKAMALVLTIAFAPVAGGCAVVMAASGQPDPNIAALEIGQDRGIVLLYLGTPSKTNITQGRRVDIFNLERGDEPSIGRAALHAVMDLLTFFLWEIIATPLEGFAGEKLRITVHYDADNRVSSVQSE